MHANSLASPFAATENKNKWENSKTENPKSENTFNYYESYKIHPQLLNVKMIHCSHAFQWWCKILRCFLYALAFHIEQMCTVIIFLKDTNIMWQLFQVSVGKTITLHIYSLCCRQNFHFHSFAKLVWKEILGKNTQFSNSKLWFSDKAIDSTTIHFYWFVSNILFYAIRWKP